MIETIVPALIAAAASVISNIIMSRKQASEIDSKLTTQQAVTETKLDELTREVRLHNNFAQRVPVIEEQIKMANNRIENLEGYHKPKD